MSEIPVKPRPYERANILLRRGARALIPNGIRSGISEFVRGRFLPYRSRDWDAEYRSGFWNRLENACELVRYSAIAGYYTYNWPGGSVLDVGCGSGVLYRRLRLAGPSKYVGIDISESAIAQARMLTNDSCAEFHCVGAEAFTSQVGFDVIVFNEVLYYFPKPINIIERLMGGVKPGGGCIVSMFRKASNDRIWRDLERALRIEDTVRLTNQDGVTWDIKVFRRRKKSVLTGEC